MEIKSKLRLKHKELRKQLNNRAELDKKIQQNLFQCKQFKNAKTILCFVSMPIEVDTINIIRQALKLGKVVAVPKWDEKSMQFYRIDSIDNLENIILKEEIITADICILPGLSFDKQGNRLGFGGGYYDRYLSKNKIFTIGVCYNVNIESYLPAQPHDIKADIIITEKGIIYDGEVI
ncbi:MAG: 5-formyltetrahydrofolate cyclo-ligase [Oscillospiraceae bacterium]